MTLYTSTEAKAIVGLTLWILGAPFAISLFFWFSPYLGWPALLVFGLFWVGSFVELKEVKEAVRVRRAREEAEHGNQAP